MPFTHDDISFITALTDNNDYSNRCGYAYYPWALIDTTKWKAPYTCDLFAVSDKEQEQKNLRLSSDILFGRPVGVLNTKNNCIEEIIEYERIDKENIKLPSGEIVNIENIYKL